MLLNQKCSTCGEVVPEEELVECDICHDQLHGACEAFETKYECPQCGDETWIGAQEF